MRGELGLRQIIRLILVMLFAYAMYYIVNNMLGSL